MGLVTALLSGLGVAAVGRMFEPDFPDARSAPDFDFDAETARSLEERKQSEDPQLRDLLTQQTKNALSLSRGELPAEVEATLRRVAAENTVLRGLSSEQGTRLTTQAIGVSQLDAMKRGSELTQLLEHIQQNEWTTAADSALSKANLLFTNYATQEKYRLAKWQQKATSHNALFTGLATGVAAGALDMQDPTWARGGFGESPDADWTAGRGGVVPYPKAKPTG